MSTVPFLRCSSLCVYPEADKDTLDCFSSFFFHDVHLPTFYRLLHYAVKLFLPMGPNMIQPQFNSNFLCSASPNYHTQ